MAYANLERSGDKIQTHRLPIGNLTVQKPNFLCYPSRLENARTYFIFKIGSSQPQFQTKVIRKSLTFIKILNR